jgi:hypothetical protein
MKRVMNDPAGKCNICNSTFLLCMLITFFENYLYGPVNIFDHVLLPAYFSVFFLSFSPPPPSLRQKLEYT